jgi:hypothetical protein
MAFLPGGIEHSRRNEILHSGQKPLKLLKNLSTPQSEFEAMRRSNEKIILKHRACPLQGPAHGGLAEEQAGCCCGDAFLLGNRSKGNQQIQISLTQFL